MDTFEGFIRRVIKSLNSAGIDYMFTGALAASYYGTPRTTMNANAMIRILSADKPWRKLVSTLKETGLQVEEHKIDAAFETDFRIATFRDNRSPFTLDTILSTEKLEKRPGTILGLSTFYQTPEELILAKLHMIRATVPRQKASKDEEDVKGILRFTKVNVNVLRKEATRNNTLSVLTDILKETKG